MKKINWFPILIVTLGYLLISFIFYGQIWQQVIYQDPADILTAQGESHVYEFVAETVYQNIISLKNPFSEIPEVLNPYGWNFAPDDVAPINGFYFLLLRPFLSIHQAFMLIVILSVILSSFSMYLLARVLDHDRLVSFITGAVYGFTPFVSYRIWGHPTYVALYLFSLPALFFILLSKEKRPSIKFLYSSLLGVNLALCPLTNLYFTIMIGLMIGLVTTIGLVFERKKIITIVKGNYRHIVWAVWFSCLLLLPWVVKVIESLYFNGYAEARPVTDSVLLSADLISILWPVRNPFYASIILPLSDVLSFRPRFEIYSYLGVALISTSILYLKIRNKLPLFLKAIFASSIFLYIFTLGPFLRFIGKTTFIDLPYQFLYRLPFVQMARAPGRFIAPVIFLLSIILAYVLSYLTKKTTRLKKITIALLLLAAVLIDQSVKPAPVETIVLPTKIYSLLLHHQEGPLLEIPFTVRDGIKNFGFANSVWSTRVMSLHGHSIFSLYAGRVPEVAFSTIQNDALFGPLGRLIDVKTTDRAKILNEIDFDKAEESLEFKNISYAILRDYQKYSLDSESILKHLNFTLIMRDNGYSLWQRVDANNNN